MDIKRRTIFIGTVISLSLSILLITRIDWFLFTSTLKQLTYTWLGLAIVIIAIGIALRALRWNLVALNSVENYSHFWRSTNIGYLGNTIYPLRIGEALRVFTINQFAHISTSQATASAVIDRCIDIIMLILFSLWVIYIHGTDILGMQSILNTLSLLIFFMLILFTLTQQKRIAQFADWLLPNSWYSSIEKLINQFTNSTHIVIQKFTQWKFSLMIASLGLLIFVIDYIGIWFVMFAFDWSLPNETAITVGVFLAVATSLPSAPGYLGIYQIACVLALGLYGLDDTLAVAYAIVLQLVTVSVILFQGIVSLMSYNLNLRHYLTS